MSERPRDRTVPTVYAHRGLALWLADAALARALGWARPVPLLAAHLPRAAFRLQGAAWLAAWLLVPYLLWIAYATTLNLYMVFTN